MSFVPLARYCNRQDETSQAAKGRADQPTRPTDWPMQPTSHAHGASLSESRVPAQLITIVVPGRAVANAMMQVVVISPPRPLSVSVCSDTLFGVA